MLSEEWIQLVRRNFRALTVVEVHVGGAVDDEEFLRSGGLRIEPLAVIKHRNLTPPTGGISVGYHEDRRWDPTPIHIVLRGLLFFLAVFFAWPPTTRRERNSASAVVTAALERSKKSSSSARSLSP